MELQFLAREGAAVREAATRYLGWSVYWHKKSGC
jgi:hypothetical protein